MSGRSTSPDWWSSPVDGGHRVRAGLLAVAGVPGPGGIGSTMFTVSAVALLVRLAPASIRARVTAAYASAFLLGGIGGPVVGGLLGSLKACGCRLRSTR